MILQILNTLLLSATIHTNFYNQFTKKQLEPNREVNNYVNYVEDIEKTNEVGLSPSVNWYPKIADTYTSNGITYNNVIYDNLPGYVQYDKADYYKSFSAMTIRGNTYIQRCWVQDPNNAVDQYQYAYISNRNNNNMQPNNTLYYMKSQIDNYTPGGISPGPIAMTAYPYQNQNYTTSLLVLEITPYNYNVGTESTIRYATNIHYGTISGTFAPVALTLQTDVYTSIEREWNELIGLNNYGQNLPRLLQQYIGGENGFNYQSQHYDKVVENNSNETLIQTVELQLTPNTSNYVIIEMKLAGYYGNNNPLVDGWSDQYVYLRRNDNSYRGVANIERITISGTMYIPTGEQEIVDIPGLMFDILGMPFTFISIAFNLTLFPGTPYAVNISNLFLSILGILIFMFLLNLILKRK